MEAFLFLGLVAIAVVLLVALMIGLRFDSKRRHAPLWLLAVILTIELAMLIVAVTFASWWNVVTFLMLTAVSGALLLQDLRVGRSN